MFEKIKALFGARPAAATTQAPTPTPTPTSAAAAPQAPAPPDEAVRLLSADDPANPFVFEGYDCAAFARSMISTTKDPGIAAQFSAGRTDPGSAHIGQLPAQAVALECSLAYDSKESPTEGVLFKASAMEEKWDIYLYGGRLYFARSWTAALAFVAEFEMGEGRLRIPRVWASAGNEALAVRQVDYLVKSHLQRRVVPHPLPAGFERDPHTVGLYSFSQYGRVCWFGTFADTLVDRPLKATGTAA